MRNFQLLLATAVFCTALTGCDSQTAGPQDEAAVRKTAAAEAGGSVGSAGTLTGDGSRGGNGDGSVASQGAAADVAGAAALSAAARFVTANHGLAVPSDPGAWQMSERLVMSSGGSETMELVAAPWSAMVSRPVLESDEVTHEVELTNDVTGFLWRGAIDPSGSVSELISTAQGEYRPIDEAVCSALADLAAGALELPVGRTLAPFEDYSAGKVGAGCRVSASGTGSEVTSARLGQLREALSSAMWIEDMEYRAGGPMGSLEGYRQGDAVCLLAVTWQPRDPSDCPTEGATEGCEPPPDRRNYVIALDCAVAATQSAP